MIPDDVLLEIFYLCADESPHSIKDIEAWWRSLVHVCRRWRTVVFGSPRSLNLRLVFKLGNPRDLLDVWPALPLIIWDNGWSRKGVDDVNALLGHHHRVCQINFTCVSSSRYLKKVSAAMQVPFLQLTNLVLQSYRLTMPDLPDSFLGGSAPRLRKLSLNRIQFPGLPKLLLSATQLVGQYF
jgi:F-box-like